MLNILFNINKEEIYFEINKANLIIENFTFNPEILLLGGKEIDVRELYRNTKLLLENKKHEVGQYKRVIDEQTEELAILRKQADDLRANVENLINTISASEGKLNYLYDSVKVQQYILSSKLLQIKEQEVKIEKQKNDIKIKETKIGKVTIELEIILAEKEKQQQIIDKQKTNLSNKENIIVSKNRQLLLSSALTVMLILVAISIFYSFSIRKKANKKQLLINHELENKKIALEETLQKLTEAQSQLIQSEKMASLGVLTAGIAHEINNPVNYINSGLEGLNTVSSQITNVISKYQQLTKANSKTHTQKIEEQTINEELNFLSKGIQTLTKNIQTGVSRTTGIIKSLKTFSHVDDDVLILTDIHENIDSTITLLHNQFKNRIRIVKNYSIIPSTYCYSSKLNQVFMNIFSNAIQAIEDKGTISISTFCEDNFFDNNIKYIKIIIKDTGKGMPNEVQDKIFEPFFTTKQVGQGTGLGLSITHGIIEQHNGKIKFTSSIEKGTEFELYLPLVTKKNKQL